MLSSNPLFLFRSRYVRAIFVSSLFSQLGIWIRNFAVLLYVVAETNGDALAVSLISVAEYAPIFIFSFIGGVFADRWRPKRTMLLCEVLSALSILPVFGALESGSEAWGVVVLSVFGSSILSQFAQPSGMKLFKLHMSEEEAPLCMSLLQTLSSVFMVAGPVVGTWVYQQVGVRAALLIVSAAFLLSAAALARIPADERKPRKDAPREAAGRRSSIMQDMKDGFRYVIRSRSLLMLSLCFAVIGLGVGLITPLGVFVVTEKLGLPAEGLKWLNIPYGLGEILGGIAAFGLAAKIPPQRLLIIGLISNALGIALVGMSSALWLTMAAQFFVALLQPAIFIGNQTLVMQHTEPAYIGRVTGIRSPLMTGSMLLMMSLSGALKHALQLEALYGIAGFCFLGGFLMLIPLPQSGNHRSGRPTR
ncbi:MFS transporter [Paenibacillus sp. M1]|uniref:MFS transporter n=1 Tax=Paenibacillus haidiansis TaxID=1574488 RepID=A0ABU7VX97_9BACL